MKKILIAVIGVGVLVLLAWAFLQGRQERSLEAERERPVTAPSRVSVQQNETIVSLDAVPQQKSGIATVALKTVTRRDEQSAYAQVLEMHEWSDARNAYIAAQGQIEKARAAAEESRRDLARTKMLQSGSGVSVEAVQEADVRARSDQATVQPAEAAVHLLEGSIRERWGEPLASWLIAGSPEIDELVAQRTLLVQVTLPSGVRFSQPPPAAMIKTSSDHSVEAKFISQAARLDPRLQGHVLFYLAPATERGPTPGLTTTAMLLRADTARGAIVPADAVVWSQGKPWVYVQTDTQHFVRRPVATDVPTENGWFVTTGLSPGDHLVTKGAQQLLSEEFRSQIQVGD